MSEGVVEDILDVLGERRTRLVGPCGCKATDQTRKKYEHEIGRPTWHGWFFFDKQDRGFLCQCQIKFERSMMYRVAPRNFLPIEVYADD